MRTHLIMRTVPLGLALLFGSQACSPSTENDPQIASISVRDSAGVEVVEAPREVIEALPEWSLELSLDLGGADASPEHEFFRVNGARILTDGTLVVVNSGSQQVLFFDQQGNLENVVGGDGDGPEEFRFPVWALPLPGDSLLVFDRRVRRLSVISPERRIVRSARLEGSPVNSNLEGVLDSRQVVLTNLVVTMPAGAEPQENETELLLYDLDGVLVRKIGDFAGVRFVALEGRPLVNVVFDALTSFAAGGTGIWIGTGRDYQVRMVDDGGKTTLISRWWGPDRTVTSSDRERWREERIADAETAEERERARERASQTVFAERRAAYGSLWSARSGDLWIREYQPWPSDTLEWLVLDAVGHPKARVHTPRGLRVFDILDDRIVGAMDDDLDVAHVVVFQLVKE